MRVWIAKTLDANLVWLWTQCYQRCNWPVARPSDNVHAGGRNFEHILWNYCSFVLCGSSEHFKKPSPVQFFSKSNGENGIKIRYCLTKLQTNLSWLLFCGSWCCDKSSLLSRAKLLLLLLLLRRTFSVLRSTCSWWVTTDVGKPSAICQPARPTQPFIP